jgi:hypothetical protein
MILLILFISDIMSLEMSDYLLITPDTAYLFVPPQVTTDRESPAAIWSLTNEG